ncbi:ABC transporter substrate-binding protein [Paenibacillus sp. TRM 82003]|nr:ABC transporter substrate-binding protein [Paenibacillus sp. TRM 82003]
MDETMKRSMQMVGLIALSVALLVGCTSQTSTPEEASGGSSGTSEAPSGNTSSPAEPAPNASIAQAVQIAMNAQPTTIDTHITTAWVTTHIARHIYEPLVAANENYEIVPMLAESYEVSDDSTEITFKLRQGVTFHNGKEMTSEDVVASMNRWKSSTTVGKATFGEAVFEAVDDYTVKINLGKPSGVAMQVMINTNQFAAIMPKEVVESAGETGVTEYIGTGPYRFAEWKQDQYVLLEKYSEYQPVDLPSSGVSGAKAAHTEQLFFNFVTDASTRVAGLQSGQFDIALELPVDDKARLDGDPSIETVVSFSGYNPMIMNNKTGFFSDVKARQAVAAALDMEEIMMAAYGSPDFYRVDHGIMMKEQSAWYSEAGKENYNQNNAEKAKQLLEEAGYNGEPVRLMVSRDYPDHYNSGVVVKSQLEEIGMNIQLDVYDWGTVLSKQPDDTAWDFFITTFGTKTDPSQILYLDSRNQWAGWTNNPKIDGWLDQIRTSTSMEESKKLFDQVQEEFWATVPVIKLGDKYSLMATGSKVENFVYFEGPVFWNVLKNE